MPPVSRLLVGFATLAVWAQDNTIRTTVPLIVAPASVTDKQGRPVYGLTAGDFELLDQGRAQPVQVAVTDDGLAPVAVVVAVETTDIALSALGKIRKTGALMANAVAGEHGETAVVTFDEGVNILQDFTTDAKILEQAIGALKPSDSEQGRMIDAVSKSLDMLASRPGPRRSSIVLISDSKDRGSTMKLEELLAKAERSGITIYSVTYSAYATPFTTKADEYQPPNGGGLIKAIGELARNGKTNTVAALTGVTGGRRFGFATRGKLENQLIQLGTDLHGRYLLSFRPVLQSPPEFHRLELHVRSHPDAVVRMRSGYWTGAATPQ